MSPNSQSNLEYASSSSGSRTTIWYDSGSTSSYQFSNSPVNGQLLYDSVGQVLQVYLNGKWNNVKSYIDGILEIEDKKPVPVAIIDKSLFELED